VTILTVTRAFTTDVTVEALLRSRFPNANDSATLTMRDTYRHHRLLIGPKVDPEHAYVTILLARFRR